MSKLSKTEIELEESAMPHWLKEALNTTDNNSIGNAFRLLYDDIAVCLKSDDLDSLGQHLRWTGMYASLLNPVIPVSALRLTWIVRHSISEWSIARDKVKSALIANAYDADMILSGLNSD